MKKTIFLALTLVLGAFLLVSCDKKPDGFYEENGVVVLYKNNKPLKGETASRFAADKNLFEYKGSLCNQTGEIIYTSYRKDGNYWIVTDPAGTSVFKVFEEKYKDVRVEGNYFVITNENGEGLRSIDGNTFIDPSYQKLSLLKKDIFSAQIEAEKFVLFNAAKGEPINKSVYTKVEFENERFIGYKGKVKWFVNPLNGKESRK